MSLVHENPIPTLEFDSEVVVVIEDGIEWSPFDKGRLAVNSDDWMEFGAEDRRPMRAAEMVASQSENNVPSGHNTATNLMRTLAYTPNSQEQLARIFHDAPVPTRANLLDAAQQIEDDIANDPMSFPLCDVKDAKEPIRVACRLPLAIYFSVDDQKAQVLIRRIDKVSNDA